MATISVDTTLTSHSVNEGFTINSGATLTIDASVYNPDGSITFGSLLCNTEGRLRIVNNTTTPTVIALGSFNYDINFTANGVFESEGQLIEIATGNGLPGQSIDFSNINGVSIDFPCAVWVEESPGGELYPYLSLGDKNVDAYPLSFVGTDPGIGYTGSGGVAGTWELGRYFEYDTVTQIATFGDGVNGHPIPSGCKVFFQNIHITSQAQTVLASKTQVISNATGTWRISKTSFSRNIYFPSQQAFVEFNQTYVSKYLYNVLTTTAGSAIIDHVAVSPQTETNGTYSLFQIASVAGDVYVNHYYHAMSYDGLTQTSARYLMNVNNTPNFTRFDNVYLSMVNMRNSTTTTPDAALHYVATISNISNINLENWTLIGGYSNIGVFNNVIMRNWKFSMTPFEPSVGFYPPPAKWQGSSAGLVSMSNSDTIKMTKWRLLDLGVPPYQVMYTIAGNCKNVEMYDHNIPTTRDGNIYTSYLMLTQVANFSWKNCTYGLVRSAAGFFTQSLLTANNLIENIRGDYATNHTLRVPNSGQVNFVSGNLGYTGINGGVNMGPFALLYSDADQVNGTEGVVNITFQPGATEGTVVGGYFNNGGRLYLPQIGGYGILQTKIPMRGITGFRTGTIIFNGSGMNSFTNYSYEFEMCNGDEDFTGSWFSISSLSDMTPFQTAFAALTGYDNRVGLKMRYRLTANIANAGSYIRTLDIPCTVDPTWEADDAYVTFDGGSETDMYELRKYSDTSVVYTFYGVGRHDFPVSPVLGELIYFVRYVNVGGSYDRTMATKPNPITAVYGNNGIIKMYAGDEVQVASSAPEAIWTYSNRELTEGFDSADREQLNKTLTTGKFIALK